MYIFRVGFWFLRLEAEGRVSWERVGRVSSFRGYGYFLEIGLFFFIVLSVFG